MLWPDSSDSTCTNAIFEREELEGGSRCFGISISEKFSNGWLSWPEADDDCTNVSLG